MGNVEQIDDMMVLGGQALLRSDQGGDLFDEHLRLYRFADIIIHTHCQALFPVTQHGVGCNGNNGDMICVLISSPLIFSAATARSSPASAHPSV